MKKFIAILLILVMVFALSCAAFADTDVSSPNAGDDDSRNHDKPSPQTGDLMSVVLAIAAAVLAVGVAFFCGRKLILDK